MQTLPVDGVCSGKTLDTIKMLHNKYALAEPGKGIIKPDSVVLKTLIDNSKAKTNVTCFPLKTRPAQSYKTGMRRFGANRKGGRLHAGCDLYAKEGTEVLALKDGVVLGDIYEFYLGTFAIDVDHGDYIARYGEISDVVKGIKKGSKVKVGQVIAYVGKLERLNMSMLHLELYSGTEKGALTRKSNKPYQRRSDLIDPTKVLDAATNVFK